MKLPIAAIAARTRWLYEFKKLKNPGLAAGHNVYVQKTLMAI